MRNTWVRVFPWRSKSNNRELHWFFSTLTTQPQRYVSTWSSMVYWTSFTMLWHSRWFHSSPPYPIASPIAPNESWWFVFPSWYSEILSPQPMSLAWQSHSLEWRFTTRYVTLLLSSSLQEWHFHNCLKHTSYLISGEIRSAPCTTQTSDPSLGSQWIEYECEKHRSDQDQSYRYGVNCSTSVSSFSNQ